MGPGCFTLPINTHHHHPAVLLPLLLQARGYKNTSLSSLFMMNNVHYIQWSVETSPAAVELLGSAWLERHKDLVEEWGAGYHDATWMPLVHMLKVRPRACVGGGEGGEGRGGHSSCNEGMCGWEWHVLCL
jgi:hypothetical protein